MVRQGKFWAYAMVGVFCLQVIAGALISVQPQFGLVPAFCGAVLLVAALWRLRKGFPSKTAFWASLILVGTVTVSTLQLVPLPPSVWLRLPARDFVVTTLNAIGQTPGWMPFSLAPRETFAGLVYCLPAIGLFFASLSLAPKHRKTIILALVTIAILSTFLGLVQRAGPSVAFLQLYDAPSGMGFFANSNFQGALLYSSILMMAALSISEIVKKTLHPIAIAFFATAFLIIALLGIGTTGSRSAVVLAMAAVFLCVVMLWRREIQNGTKGSFGLTFLAFSLLLFAVSQFGLVGLSRLASADTLNDGRPIMARVTIAAIKDFFPAGSGFGSFVPVYAMRETPDVMLSGYINHAHNDWLELILEGGAPMLILMVGFLMWFAHASFKAWQERADDIGDFTVRASAAVVLLLMLHSLTDYPLRTRALMALFAMCCGFLAYGPEHRRGKILRKASSSNQKQNQSDIQAQPPKVDDKPRGPYFVRKDKGSGN